MVTVGYDIANGFTWSGMLVLITSVIYSSICYRVSSDWVILRQSTNIYNEDWNDINRYWQNIKHIRTNNGNYIKQKCKIYLNGDWLCLCKYLDIYFDKHVEHLCLRVYPQSFPLTTIIVDSFSISNDKYDNIIANAIKSGLHYYYQSYTLNHKLPIDSIFLLKLIAKNDIEYNKIANVYYHRVQSDNPFYRIFSKSSKIIQRFDDLKIVRSTNYQHTKHRVNDVYILNKKYNRFNVDPTDDIVLKALYCDIAGYDEIDFDILMNMADYKGGYMDTHTIIALNLLAENECYDQYEIHNVMSNVAKAILYSLNRSVSDFGDVFFEQIVCLYWSGFGDHIKKEWIIRIAKYQNDVDYGWSHDYPMSVSMPHPTGLAILAMIYYEIGESKQSFYPVDVL